MSKILDEVLAANELYAASFGDKNSLATPPVRHFAILTCMDARLDPVKFAGLHEGEAYIIRNAGGRVSDYALLSLVISAKILGTREWFVIHHTDCGMERLTNEMVQDLMGSSSKNASLDAQGNDALVGRRSTENDFIDWLIIRDQPQSVIADVERIRNHPLVPSDIVVYGYIYDVKTGKLVEVPEANRIGKPR